MKELWRSNPVGLGIMRVSVDPGLLTWKYVIYYKNGKKSAPSYWYDLWSAMQEAEYLTKRSNLDRLISRIEFKNIRRRHEKW
jgi:hypothetical protein